MPGGETHELHLLRHAKSSWDDPALADHDRPLAPRGIRAAAHVAEHLRANGIAPALVLCSTALRTRETLAALLPVLGAETDLRLEDDLYGALAGELLARLREVSDTVPAVLLIGHNPGLEDLVGLLAGAEAPDRFPTAALATFELDGSWTDLGKGPCRLVAYTLPR
jgi:phosphohistidine phosphatase